jgi:Polysaccharide deacetylase
MVRAKISSTGRVTVFLGMLFAVALLAGCTAGSAGSVRRSAPATRSHSTSRPAPRTSVPAIPLRAWHGPVEQLFVHPLVINPRLAFTNDTLGVGFQQNFVTAREFGLILDQLWRNGWTLVDIHRVAEGTVRVPLGRRPLVLGEDDANYYHYFDGRGLAARLLLDGTTVRAELPNGRLTDDDVVPLVEAAIAKHPEFSADGARGVLAVTGYEGLFGEHHLSLPAARGRLRALAHWLTGHGWTIASHTWGHIDLSMSTPADLAWDLRQWQAQIEPIIGTTDVLTYPFGARPDGVAVRRLVQAGYRIQCDIDIVARTTNMNGAIVMSRRHVDGFAFDVPHQQTGFYDVAAVRDPARPN